MAHSFADRSVRFKSLGISNKEKRANFANVPCSKTHFKLRQSPLVVRQQAALFISQNQQASSAIFTKRVPRAMLSPTNAEYIAMQK